MPSKKRKKQPRAASSKQRPGPTSKQPAQTAQDELDEAELEQVSGGAGKVVMQDIHFTMTTTKSSSNL